MRTYTATLRRRNITLLEVLVYVSLVALISGLAVRIFWGGMDASATVRESSDRVLKVLRRGDQWRQDIRSATSVKVQKVPTSIQLVKADGQKLTYRFTEHKIWRIPEGSAKNLFLESVEECRFTIFSTGRTPAHKSDKNSYANRFTTAPMKNPTAWKMALELQTKQDKSNIDPLFDFIAVPQNGGDS